MPRLQTFAAALAAALLASACYRVTVVTGAAPSATVVDKPWNNSFVIGLVPPPPVDVSKQCPAGVSSVVTQRSFLNGLVSFLTSSIYTPLQVTATCAGSTRTSSLGLPPEFLGTPATDTTVAATTPTARP